MTGLALCGERARHRGAITQSWEDWEQFCRAPLKAESHSEYEGYILVVGRYEVKVQEDRDSKEALSHL